jgi:hypothetical protein
VRELVEQRRLLRERLELVEAERDAAETGEERRRAAKERRSILEDLKEVGG